MKSFLMSAALAVAAICTAWARPAYPGLLYATMEDGSQVAYHLVGDEFSHAYITLDGRHICPVADLDASVYTMADDLTDAPTIWRYIDTPSAEQVADEDAAGASQQRAPKANRYTDFPTIGEMHGLVILVEYPDKHFFPEHTAELFDRQLNEKDYSLYNATGSARDYFIAQSMGQFVPYFDVIGPIELPHKMSYYGGNSMGQDQRPGEMISDACRLAHDSLGIDFSQYDYDDDGSVDFVFCIYAGYGENYGASANTIWPHMSNLKAQWINCVLDGKAVDLYACSCELEGTQGSHLDGIGAVCHEFGHVLGLPDAYNTRNSYDTQLGSWDVMDAGSYNNDSRTPPAYSSFERHQVGWLEYIELVDPQDTIIVPELTQSNVAYRITTPNNRDEFFTLENRQQVGWDAYHDGRGLMIFHIDYNSSVWARNQVNSGSQPHYDLVEADGTQGRSPQTDLYPNGGNTMFTDYSKPNSLSWKGVPTKASVTHITQLEDGTISFKFKNDMLAIPTMLPAVEVTDTSFVAQWTAVKGAIGYSMHIYEQMPDSINPLLIAEDFAKAETGKYPSSVGPEISDDLYLYLNNEGWTGSEIYTCGGMVRIGRYGVTGKLVSPILAPKADSILVALTCCAYMGREMNYDVVMLDSEKEELQRQTFVADRNKETQIVLFDQCPDSVYVMIETQEERLFLDDIRIAKGTIDSLAWDLKPREWDVIVPAEDVAALADDTTDDAEEATVIQQAVTSLMPGYTYYYYVIALDSEPMLNSSPSIKQHVTLSTPSGIDRIEADRIDSRSTVTYDLQGRIVNDNTKELHRGIYLRGGQKLLVR